MAEKKKVNQNYITFIAYASICIGVIVTVLFLNAFETFDNLENSTKDMRFRIRGVEDHADEIVIVGIDPQTLEMLMLIDMPPRDFHAQLVENLYRAGAKAVLFDVLFLNYTGETDDLMSLEQTPSANDSLLAETIAKYPNTVIARKIKVEMRKSTQQTVAEATMPPELFRNPGQLAFVNMFQDGDSFIRRTRLISNDLPSESGWNYSYALKAVMFAAGADTAWIDEKKHIAHVGDIEIPLTDDNFMIINYAMDEETFQKSGGYISYEQVMDSSEYGIGALIERERFKDKVVMVGAAWPESHDDFPTPFYKGTNLFTPDEYPMYGVHVHKNIATTILKNRFIPPTKYWQFVLLVILMAVISSAISYKFRGFSGLLLCIVLVAAYSGLALWMFLSFRRQIPVVAPAFVTVFINYLGAVTYNFLSERKQKAMIRGAFAQYVPPAVVSELVKNPDMLTLGGEERVMSVIFSDVAGFTTISEGLTPTQLVELLNEYLTAMTDVILGYNGIIDKYEGDAIMAEFGAPLPDEEHALKACLAAIDMQARLAVLREKLLKEGRPELRARVGINSGAMVIGNMGSTRIFDYTVMGDNVNLSSRLEGANKVYSTYIMCSEATRKLAGDSLIYRELDLLRVKGKTTGVLVHEIIGRKSDGLSENKAKCLECYREGLAAYKERRWSDGLNLFNEALSFVPDDGPSKVYIERCTEFIGNPPPDDWDGIFTMRTK